MKAPILMALSTMMFACTAQALEVDHLKCNEQKVRYVLFALSSANGKTEARLVDGYTRAQFVCHPWVLNHLSEKGSICRGMYIYNGKPAQAKITKDRQGKIQVVVNRYYGGNILLDCELKKVKVSDWDLSFQF